MNVLKITTKWSCGQWERKMDKQAIQRIANAQKHVKLMAKQFGRDSQQYKDAIKYQADIVLKQMTGA